MNRLFKPVSITLTDRDKQKLEHLAQINSTNCSDMVRQMIRAKRLPRKQQGYLKPTVLSSEDRRGHGDE